MSKDEERNENDKREVARLKRELKEIQDDLMEELGGLHKDFKDEIEDLREEGEDIKEDLREDLEDLKEERLSLLDEIGDMNGELENLGEHERGRIKHAEEKLEHLKEKVKKHEGKYGAKIRKKVEKATKKVEEKAKRINISVDPEMSDEWRDWAEDLGASVSELVRKSMKFVKNNIGDIRKIERWGKKMEKMGGSIEKAVKNSGIEEIGERLEKQFGKNKGKAEIKMAIIQESDKERIKKRVSGLIKLHKSLPIDKLAQALNRSNEEAENLVYELVADGIEGTLEEGVFKFTSTSEEVISKLNELINRM